MENRKEIKNRLEDGFGFEKCSVNEPKSSGEDEFEADCKNSYKDAFSCQGKFDLEKGTLSKTTCEKKE